jgi:gliding motility-associated-like protein
MKKGLKGAFIAGYGDLLMQNAAICVISFFVFCMLLLLNQSVGAQTCNVINSFPATPPKSGKFDMLVAAKDPDYSVKGSRIFDSYNINGIGTYTQIDTNSSFWTDDDKFNPGPMNRCSAWGASNPSKMGFSICVDIPADATYYMGFGADNNGELTIDGDTVLKNIGFDYWGIYKRTFSKGEHLVEFSVLNYGGVAAIGFEIYNAAPKQLIDATGYAGVGLVFSTMADIGGHVEEGDPNSSYSCPVGSILDYCASNVPVCSQFVPITLTLNNPPVACSSVSVDLTAPAITAGNPSSLTYTYWLDSLATKPLIDPSKVTKSGTYYIMGSFNGCYLIKPVSVLVSAVSTTIDKNICPGESYSGHSKSGTYTDTLKAGSGCDSLVTLNLTVATGVNLGGNRGICPGDSVKLAPGAYSQYLWQDNSTKPYYTVKTPGSYWVTVTDQNGCSSSDTVSVSYGACFDAKIPNTFTPNGDGVNDTWKIDALQSFPQCSVLIYDRWGQEVFRSTGYVKAWDGTISGKNLPVGTYYYLIDLKNNAPPLSGFVTIIR